MTIPDENARRAVVAKELAASAQDPDRERSRLVWKKESVLFDVIRLPLDMVVLNANSHRVKAQLESESAERRKIVHDTPWSDEAQSIIAEIIERTQDFEDILAEMRDPGQREPGVVSRVGVLINANTRVVALRKINAQNYVNVMVLPENALPKEIALLEADLQEKRDVKQPYTPLHERPSVHRGLEGIRPERYRRCGPPPRPPGPPEGRHRGSATSPDARPHPGDPEAE